MSEQAVMKENAFRIIGEVENWKLIMRRSFFFGNHNGIGPGKRDYIADSVVQFLDSVMTG